MARRCATAISHMSPSRATTPSAVLPRLRMISMQAHAPGRATSGRSPACSNSSKRSSIWRGVSSAGVLFLRDDKIYV